MKEELKIYGLSDKEIDLYIACLKTGEATSNRLSEITDIRRSTVYEVIDSLKKKGIITSFSKNKKFYFRACKPKNLITLLKEKQRITNSIIPELEALSQSISEKPKLELYEGIASIKAVVLEMLNHKEILVYGGSTVGDIIFGHFTENFARKRVQRKIKMKAIIGKTVPKHMLETDIKKLTQVKTLEIFENHKTVYFIYGNNLLSISMGQELIATKITDPLLVESQRKVFDFLWGKA